MGSNYHPNVARLSPAKVAVNCIASNSPAAGRRLAADPQLHRLRRRGGAPGAAAGAVESCITAHELQRVRQRPWLSVAPASGFPAGPGNRLSLTVSVDASELSQGSHRALLLTAGTGFRNLPQRVNVSVTMAPAAFADSRALEYDADDSLSIDLDEALEAVRDYFAGLISLEDVLKIVRLYFIC